MSLSKVIKALAFCLLLCIAATITLMLMGCTLSFQNISTHGTATDVVDEELQTDPVIKPAVTIPVPLGFICL